MPQKLSNLPVGSKVKFGHFSRYVGDWSPLHLTWIIAAKNHVCTPSYPSNSVTLVTGIVVDKDIFDVAEPNNPNSARKSGGNNRYSVSNVDQWLNADGAYNAWYTPQHEYDNYSASSGFSNIHAFLYGFTNQEKRAILPTTIRVSRNEVDGGGYEDITRKVFLPSITEVMDSDTSGGTKEGAVFEYFSTVANRKANYVSGTTSTPTAYWLRTPCYNTDECSSAYRLNTDGKTITSTTCNTYNEYGLRPALNLSGDTIVSDTLDDAGCYVVMANEAPPSTAFAPFSDIVANSGNHVSWEAVEDPNEDEVSYELDCAIDGGDFVNIYTGQQTWYNHFIGSVGSLQYRVRAVDTMDVGSEYTYSDVLTVKVEAIPKITGNVPGHEEGGLIESEDAFKYVYSVNGVSNATVTESIDGVEVRTYTVAAGDRNTFDLNDEGLWLKLSAGSHTLTVTAVADAGNLDVVEIPFIKNVLFAFVKTNTFPTTSEVKCIYVEIERKVPEGAIFMVEASRNALCEEDPPTYENITEAVLQGKPYYFTEPVETNGVHVLVAVERNGTEGECYIGTIRGGFR